MSMASLYRSHDATTHRRRGTWTRNSPDFRGNRQRADRADRPNYFFAIQITNPEIKRGLQAVQQNVEKACPELKPAFVSVDSAHLTLAAINLPDEVAVNRAIDAMHEFQKIYKQERQRMTQNYQRQMQQQQWQTGAAVGGYDATSPIMVEVKGLGNFWDKVVFAKVAEGQALDQITHIAELLRRCVVNRNIKIDTRPFAAHITLMKLSKNPEELRAAGISNINRELYGDFRNTYFGGNPVITVQLCSMLKPKQNMYYHIEHEIPINCHEHC